MPRTWFDAHVLPAFAGRILPIDTAVALQSARLHVPNPRPLRDTFIAATALVHGMTVVTRNLVDFKESGAGVIAVACALAKHFARLSVAFVACFDRRCGRARYKMARGLLRK